MSNCLDWAIQAFQVTENCLVQGGYAFWLKCEHLKSFNFLSVMPTVTGKWKYKIP